MRADERRGVDRDRSRRHFRNRDDIRKLRHRQPLMNFNDLTLDQRHCRVTAADAEQADLEKAQKQLD